MAGTAPALSQVSGIGEKVGPQWSREGKLVEPVLVAGSDAMIQSRASDDLRFTLLLQSAQGIGADKSSAASHALLALVHSPTGAALTNATSVKLRAAAGGLLRFPTTRSFHTLVRLPHSVHRSEVHLKIELVDHAGAPLLYAQLAAESASHGKHSVSLNSYDGNENREEARVSESAMLQLRVAAVPQAVEKHSIPRLPQGIAIANKRIPIVCALRQVIARANQQAHNLDVATSAAEAVGAQRALSDADVKNCTLDRLRHTFESLATSRADVDAAAEVAKREWLVSYAPGIQQGSKQYKSLVHSGRVHQAVANKHARNLRFDVTHTAWNPAAALQLAT